jgi:hypothetical protein
VRWSRTLKKVSEEFKMQQPTDIEQPGNPQEPQSPVTPSPTQPGQGDDFTKPGKKNEQANMGRQSDEPIERQNMKEEDDENQDLELEEGEGRDDDTSPSKTH